MVVNREDATALLAFQLNPGVYDQLKYKVYGPVPHTETYTMGVRNIDMHFKSKAFASLRLYYLLNSPSLSLHIISTRTVFT